MKSDWTLCVHHASHKLLAGLSVNDVPLMSTRLKSVTRYVMQLYMCSFAMLMLGVLQGRI